jgi:hypothetical protein
VFSQKSRWVSCLDPLDALAGGIGKDLVQPVAHLAHLLGLDHHVGRGAADPARGLMQQEARIGQAIAVFLSAPTKISAPAEATQPEPMVRTVGRMNLITSWIMSPDSTCPPGEEISMLIGSSLSSARARRWATVRCASLSLMARRRSPCAT